MKTNYVLQNPPNPSSFSTANKVGGVAGCTGAVTGVQGASSNPGSQYMLKGGTKYYGVSRDAASFESMKGSYAPIISGSHNKCGGRKSRRRRRSHKKTRKTRHRRKSKHHRRKSKHHRRKSKHHRRKSKHHRRKSKRRTYKRKRQHGGYSQYLSNVPIAHGYSTGGNVSPANNALANPVPHEAYNHCQNNYNHMASKN